MIIFLSGSLYVHAQKLSNRKAAAISSLNKKAKEAVGNIRFFKNAKKLTIDDASFTATEMGVKIEVVLNEPGFPKSTWTSEFNPINITAIEDVSFPDESPVGQIRITLDYKIGYRTSYNKKDGFEHSYEDQVSLNYLKIDKDNYDQIRAALLKLQDIYKEEENEPLKPLAKIMNSSDEFWISTQGSSNTYELMRVYVTGCTMRLVYYLKSIGTAGDKTQIYITIIPFDNIDDIRLDKSKSKPNCILLQSGKKGFETFELKDKKYVLSTAVKEIPLFIDVTYDWRRDDVLEMLKTQVRECGGGKIKL